MKYAKDKQVARCGNAVPPPFAEALVRANLPECIRRVRRYSVILKKRYSSNVVSPRDVGVIG